MYNDARTNIHQIGYNVYSTSHVSEDITCQGPLDSFIQRGGSTVMTAEINIENVVIFIMYFIVNADTQAVK